MRRSFGKYTSPRDENKKSTQYLTPRAITVLIGMAAYLYICSGMYPVMEAGIIAASSALLLSLLSVYILEVKSAVIPGRVFSFVFAAGFLVFLAAANLTGGVRSPLAAAAIVPLLYMGVRAKHKEAALGAALLFLSFLHGLADFTPPDFALMSALVLFFSAMFAAGRYSRATHAASSAGAVIDTGKSSRDFEVSVFNMVTNLLNVHVHFIKPVSLLFFVRDGAEEDAFSLMTSVSVRQEAIDKNYRAYASSGVLGAALKKGAFFMFAVHGVSMPYYRSKLDIKTAAVMPVILNKTAGFIAADFEEEVKEGERAEGIKAAMTALAEELGNVIEISDIAAKAVAEERRISRVYDIYGKLNLLEGKSGLVTAFFNEIQALGIASGYIAELKADGTYEITESFNYAGNIKGTRFSPKEDDILRYITETGKMAIVDNAHDKNIRLHFKRQDRDKFAAALLRDREQIFGFVKLDKEPGDDFMNFELKTLEIILSRVSALLENAKLYEKIKDQAFHDGLTGLLNHLTFQEKLREAKEKKDRGEIQFVSLALMDIDYFKKFNDSFGHQEGDRVLKSVAKMLTEITTAHPGTFCARYGGEEFVVVMEDYDIYKATKIAEEIRAYSEKNLKGGNEKEKRAITLSIGVTAYPDYARDQREMVKNADEALYFAKEDGRNRVKSIMDVRSVDRRNK